MSMSLSLSAFATLVASASAFSSSSLFLGYSGSYPNCYRQPLVNIIPTPNPSEQLQDTILIFVEGRNISNCSGTEWPDVPDFPIMSRRSTDGGNTFSSPITITHGNLDFLTTIYDSTTSLTHLILQQGDDGVVHTTSADGGLSWSPVTNLTISNLNDFNYASVIPGVAHGLQISSKTCLDPTCGGTAGRLLLPFVCTIAGPVSNDTACGNCRTCLLVSDDHGSTWYLSALSDQQGSREASLVQLHSSDYGTMSGVIYATERNLGNTTGKRWHSISVDGGESFSPMYSAFDSTLPDVVTSDWTGIVAGAASFITPGDSSTNKRVIFTTPAAPAARQDLSVYVSLDGTNTWSNSPTSIWAGPAAYSDAVQYNSTHVAVVFECGIYEFAGQINFGFITASDLPQ